MNTETFKIEIEDVTVLGVPKDYEFQNAKLYASSVDLTWELAFELKDWGIKAMHVQCKKIKFDVTIYFLDKEQETTLEIDCLDWKDNTYEKFVDGQLKPTSVVIDYRTNTIELTF